MPLKEKILIADDSMEVLTYTAMAVEFMGYDVVKAKDGREAVDLAHFHLPDLIILDWKMPVLDGLEVTQSLKNSTPTKEIPIIMITGTIEGSEFMAKALEKGVNDFIRKPFDRIELQARIRSLLKQAKYLKKIIDNRNIEFSFSEAQLAYTTEFQYAILSKLEFLSKNVENKETISLIDELISKIKTNKKLSPFNNLYKYYSDVSSDFKACLLSKHTNLTPSEIKLCMLLRQNLDTKEIATLVSQSYDSVRVSRNRLRKKLNLLHTDNLPNYLLQI